MIHMQMQPTRKFDYEPNSRKLIRMQYLYSAVLRSMSAAENPKDQTKRLLDWRRFVAWTSRDMITGITTMVLLRCPADAQERLCGMMEDQGQYQKHLLRHPMLVHAFLAEDISFRSKTFSKAFAAPMYGLVSFSEAHSRDSVLTCFAGRNWIWDAQPPSTHNVPAVSCSWLARWVIFSSTTTYISPA